MKIFTKLLGVAAILAAFSMNSHAQFDGYCLYNEMNQNTTYLIDKDNNIAHSWQCNTSGNYAVLLKEDGNIVRGGVYSNNQLGGAAEGGIIQEYDPSGNVVWEYIYSDADHLQHHDIEIMPNGNMLLIAWEVKSAAELTQAGYSSASEKWPTELVELEPDGSGSASIVWEWHIWDHLIQDHDAAKDNYGVVADHPELIDINLIQGGGGPPNSNDWFHVNGINYNENLDQIVFTSRHLSEFFIIDHSTTTTQAATSSGGNAGMGGDILYRWGNPSNYGAPGTQVITAATHDPRWVLDGRPNEGYIQFFNNEGGNGGSSTVDAVNPPLVGYNYTLVPGEAYGPSTYDWRHECEDDAGGQSAQDRMSNGNVFVCLSQTYLYEADAAGNVIWQHNAQPSKAFRYECDYAGVSALLGFDPCDIGIGIAEMLESDLTLFPNPSSGLYTISGLDLGDYNVAIQVTDLFGKTIKQLSNTNEIDLSAQAEGIYFITLTVDDVHTVTKKVTLIK
jgi:hypothetical protein